MERISSTSSAEVTNKKQIIDAVLKQTEVAALKTAAESRAKVADVKELQRIEFLKLMNVKGSDGVAAGGEDMSIPDDLKAEIDQGIEAKHSNRMKAVAPAPDAYVLPDEGTTVGLQHDDTRKIGIAGRALENDRVAKHEAKHREQETGDQTIDLPSTGNPEIDQIRKLSRRALRENGAVKAEGGLKDHTPEYFEYVGSSNRIARYLKTQGMDGEKLVEEAGDTNAGFDKLHDSIMIASIKEKLGEKAPDVEKVLAA